MLQNLKNAEATRMAVSQPCMKLLFYLIIYLSIFISLEFWYLKDRIVSIIYSYLLHFPYISPVLPVPEKQGFISAGLDSTHSQARKSGSLPSSHHGSGLLYRKDIFYRGSLLNIQAYK